MVVLLKGIVLEVIPEYDDKKNLLSTVTARLFQKGVKTNIDVKGIPLDIVSEGGSFEGNVKVLAYHFNNLTGLSCKYVAV